jgi:hypothetical protein
MNAMEQMMLTVLEKMTGLSPDQMQGLAENAINLLRTLDARIGNIEKMVTDLHDTIPSSAKLTTSALLLTQEDKTDGHDSNTASLGS